jgi:hypothetical protein
MALLVWALAATAPLPAQQDVIDEEMRALKIPA